MTADNKAPRDIEWTAADIADHILRFKMDSGELFIEKQAYDKLQSRLEKCEGLLREWSKDLEEGGAYTVEDGFEEPKHCEQFRKINQYFAEVEK